MEVQEGSKAMVSGLDTVSGHRVLKINALGTRCPGHETVTVFHHGEILISKRASLPHPTPPWRCREALKLCPGTTGALASVGSI